MSSSLISSPLLSLTHPLSSSCSLHSLSHKKNPQPMKRKMRFPYSIILSSRSSFQVGSFWVWALFPYWFVWYKGTSLEILTILDPVREGSPTINHHHPCHNHMDLMEEPLGMEVEDTWLQKRDSYSKPWMRGWEEIETVIVIIIITIHPLLHIRSLGVRVPY